MTDQSDQKPFIESLGGRVAFITAQRTLTANGLPVVASSGDAFSMDDFIRAASAITAPSALVDRNSLSAPEMITAMSDFKINFDTFNDYALSLPAEDNSGPGPAKEISAAIDIGGTIATARFSTTSGSSGSSAGGRASGSSSAGGTTEDDPAPKRQRLGMSDADLARACTIVDMPAARVTPQFLVDKPLDVRMYTPLLVDLYASVRKMAEGISLLAKEVYAFEGDFLELSPAAVAALPTTPLFASCDIEHGSRLLHRLETIHAVAVQLRAKNLRCQRGFWLANHTPGCNWDTWEQLCHREDQDAGADLCNPGFTPLSSWEEQVKAAIAAARQETAALSKDGKTLLGPILPRLLARHNAGSARGARNGAAGRGGDKPPAFRAFTPGSRSAPTGAARGRGRGVPGKENRNKNAVASAAALAAKPAVKPPGDV